jgi:hypothetical protein
MRFTEIGDDPAALVRESDPGGLATSRHGILRTAYTSLNSGLPIPQIRSTHPKMGVS